MGELEQFAKRTFAEEVERITDGAAVWVDPPEVRLGPMQGDGFLVVRAGRADTLAALPQPWPTALAADETLGCRSTTRWCPSWSLGRGGPCTTSSAGWYRAECQTGCTTC